MRVLRAATSLTQWVEVSIVEHTSGSRWTWLLKVLKSLELYEAIVGIGLVMLDSLLGFGFTRAEESIVGIITLSTIAVTLSVRMLTVNRLEETKRRLTTLESRVEALGSQARVYTILSRIQGPAQPEALARLDRFLRELEDLSRGRVEYDPSRDLEKATGFVDEVRGGETLRVVHISHPLSYLLKWEDEDLWKQLFRANRQAIERGARIKRIFVLSKGDVLTKRGGLRRTEGASKTRRILQQHKDIGVEVIILWIDGISVPPLEDCMICEERRAQVHPLNLVTGSYGPAIRLEADQGEEHRRQIQELLSAFQRAKDAGEPIDESVFG